MMTFLTGARRAFTTAMVRSGRARARDELLRMNDRTLADAGFSRELLEAGVNAWPWRLESNDVDARASIARAATARRQAELELQQLSDRELDDLAIARADIPRAVREGRVGIELPVPTAEPQPGYRQAA